MTPLPERPPREVLRNATRRPVEMLLATGTVVLAPGETIDLPEGDRTCAVLERAGVLTRHARREPEKTAGAGKGKTTRRKAAKAAAKPGAKKPAAKPGAKKAPKPAAKARKTAKAGPKPAPARKRKTPSSASQKKRSRKPDGGSA